LEWASTNLISVSSFISSARDRSLPITSRSAYQQIGRAGRATDRAYAILLAGREDDEIQRYFIESAFPGAEEITEVLCAVEETDGLALGEIEQRVNMPQRRIENCLKFLEVEGAISREGRLYQRTPVKWSPDTDRWARVTALRQREVARMREFVGTTDCLMEFTMRELDDLTARRCGRCANCAGDLVPRNVPAEIVGRARQFLGHQWIDFEPRRRLPDGILPDRPHTIDKGRQVEVGLALCSYKDEDLGSLLRAGKYEIGRFDDRLVTASVSAIRSKWTVDSAWWVVAVPSKRYPELVRDFANRLAQQLGIDCADALIKIQNTAEQKTMENSFNQCQNVMGAFRVNTELVRPCPVLLVDDLVDSRWTLTVCGAALRRAGSGLVYPFVLASQRKNDGI